MFVMEHLWAFSLLLCPVGKKKELVLDFADWQSVDFLLGDYCYNILNCIGKWWSLHLWKCSIMCGYGTWGYSLVMKTAVVDFMVLEVLSNLNNSVIQSRNADCKKAHILLNSLFGGKNNREMVSLLLTLAGFCCCWYWLNWMLEFKKHLNCKVEEALLSRDFGSNRSRVSAKMLIYSHLPKPLEILSLHTCLRCQFVDASFSRPGFRT